MLLNYLADGIIGVRQSRRTLGSAAPVAQLDRAPGFEPVGRGFKSLRAHQPSLTACRTVSYGWQANLRSLARPLSELRWASRFRWRSRSKLSRRSGAAAKAGPLSGRRPSKSRRARSSAGLERWPPKPKVAGSNP